MRQLRTQQVIERVEDLVHKPTQLAADGIDLTVGRVWSLTGAGTIDFGGSEQRDADREEVTAVKREPDDDYGWWSLESGVYVLGFNETLALEAGELAVVSPLPRTTHAGGTHASLRIHSDDDAERGLQVVMQVGCEADIDIKENARASRLRVYEAD